MQSLFRVFSQIILKVTAIYVVVSILGILALDKLFGGYEFYLGMLVFIAPLLAWGLTFMLVPKNLDWIMALPISKRHVLQLHYMTSVFTSFVTFFASVFVLVVLALIKHDVHYDMSHVAKSAPAAVIPKDALGVILAGIDIYGWMTALLMISFFHALSMSISRPATTKRFYINLWNHANPTARWAVRTGWIGAIAIAAVLREYFFSPFGIFVGATVTFLFLTTVNTSHALAIPRRQRNRWLAISAAVAGVQIVFLFLHATKGTHSPSFDRRVASVMFLGPFSGGMAKADLARLLEADLNHERVEELGDLYKKNFWHKEKIKPSLDGDLSFERAIASKRSFADIVATARLFDFSDLGAADVRFFLGRLQPAMVECRCDYPTHELLAAKISRAEALSLLRSGEPGKGDVMIQFALIWARYRAAPGDLEFIREIERGLPEYSDRAKLAGLLTISVLGGRRYGLGDWMRKTRTPAASFGVDCARWSVETTTDLREVDAASLNFCIRRRAELTQIAEIEAAGWMEAPFDIKTRATIRRIYHGK